MAKVIKSYKNNKENWIEIVHVWKELKTKQLGMNEEIRRMAHFAGYFFVLDVQ